MISLDQVLLKQRKMEEVHNHQSGIHQLATATVDAEIIAVISAAVDAEIIAEIMAIQTATAVIVVVAAETIIAGALEST